MLSRLACAIVLAMAVLTAAVTPSRGQSLLEDRLVVLTPIPREVGDAVAEQFAEYTRRRFGVALRPTLISAGSPVAYARILEWRGRPEADLLWAGEAELFDDLAERRLLAPHDLSEALLRDIPAAIGQPRPIALRDARGTWVGTALTAAGLIYHPRVLTRLGTEPPADWDDLFDCRFKGQVVQSTPDRSGSHHASLEVILQLRGTDRGWQWAQRVGGNTALFATRSRDVPTFVARGEFGVGFGVLSYMAFQEVLDGHTLRFVSPPYAWISAAPTAILAGARSPRAAKAFLEFLVGDEGQRVMMARGLFPIAPRFRMEGPPGSAIERAAEFAGLRSFFDRPIRNVYDEKVAQRRYAEVNDLFRRLIIERHDQLKRRFCP